jgi:hypothetical protein
MRKSLRGWIVAVTILTAVVEWLLFELVRIPYRPPNDMLTLLGQEKYAVFGLMGAILVGWLMFLIGSWTQGSFTIRDYFSFIAMLAIFDRGRRASGLLSIMDRDAVRSHSAINETAALPIPATQLAPTTRRIISRTFLSLIS